MRINHNISALNAWKTLRQTNNAMSKSLEKLSSGLRINRAADDAAGLAISEKMRGQINGLNQAIRNSQDGISLIQTAEGALNETHSVLQRMRELAVQAANDTNTTSDRAKIEEELTALKSELTRIGNDTEFNTKSLLTGSLSGATIQVGANTGQNITLSIGNMRATGLSITTTALDIDTGSAGAQQSAANALIGTIDSAISSVSSERSKLGAIQNRLEHTIANLETASENLTAAESRIRDVDMAAEMMNFTKNQILTQAGTAMLAQANMKPQSVLQLMG
ncbi:MAG: flagellin [Halanaerobium sp.]|nr:flagellin [Halanaerobium sp.]